MVALMGIELMADRNRRTALIDGKTQRATGSNMLIPQRSAPIRTFPQSHYRRGLKRAAITPPFTLSRLFSVGFFFSAVSTKDAPFRPILRVPPTQRIAKNCTISRPVRPCPALCSQKIIENRIHLAQAEHLFRQRVMHVPNRTV